ncbi:MAG: GNAT family N-acetyltransferase [Phycisphaerae bacterium]|nr:GNAT family N-acetyltransferase [Phycisphaerae bacterium]
MNTYSVEEVLVSAISAADEAALRTLSGMVYPPEKLAGICQPASAPAPSLEWPAGQAERVFLLRRDGQVVATSRFLPRRIYTQQGPLDVLALAGVKTHPEFRGLGLGSAVVRAALSHVDRGAFPVSLFQTGVPEFYEKLTCRHVTNPFTNRLAADPAKTPWSESPWWEAHAMIYPAAYPWPEGPIDLCGPAW